MQVAAQPKKVYLPVPLIVRRFDVHIGACFDCHRSVRARHPPQTSDALQTTDAQFGLRAIPASRAARK
jgi:hypothetical protein